MNDWTPVFLGVIAVATLAIAVVHVAVLVTASLVVRRVGRLVDHIEQDLRPVFAHINAISRDAARAAALAGAQVERADRMFADLAQRLEQTLNAAQATLLAPAREGRAVINAFRAGLRAFRDLREHARARQGRPDDEDALFI